MMRKAQPKPPESRAGAFVHLEVLSREPKKTQEFYERVFGWKFRRIPFAGYALFETAAPPHGGLREPEGDERPGTFPYLAVDSVDETARRIVEAGGRILAPKAKIPGFGWRIVFEAPGGVVQGAFEEHEGA